MNGVINRTHFHASTAPDGRSSSKCVISAGESSVKIDAMTTTQVRAFTTEQIGALTTDQIGALSFVHLGALTTDELVAFSTDQMAALTGDQIQGFTTTQMTEASRRGSEQMGHTSVSLILWHTRQYFTSRFIRAMASTN